MSISRRSPSSRHCETLEQRHLLAATPSGLQPGQVLQAYGFNQVTFGTVAGDGRGQTIAIVDAYDDPNVAADLDVFDKTFSVNGQTLYAQYGAASNGLTKVKMSRTMRTDSGWATEIALDVEWAHAIAPAAKILLVEARSASLGDLLAAVDTARKAAGVSVVSMSWGANEFSSETSYDSYFTTPTKHNGVTFLASSGDSGAGTIWPSISTNVISVGGTSLKLNTDNSYLSESGWSGSGGGISTYELKPGYQSTITLSSTKKVGPDVAYDADPNTGFAVYDSVAYNGQSGWFTVGGTSAGAPQWAGLVAIANQGRALQSLGTLDGRAQTLNAIYNMGAANFHDITSGSNGAYAAGAGFDLVTGRGSPFASSVIPALVSASSSGTVDAAYQLLTAPSGSGTTLFSQIRLADQPGGIVHYSDGNAQTPAVSVNLLLA